MNIDPVDYDNLTLYDVLRMLVDRIPSTTERERIRLVKAIDVAQENNVFRNEGTYKL